jgi:hypothetical protein
MAKLIKRDISELSRIVTVNGFQVVGMLIVQPQSQEPKMLKYLIFALQEENPRVTRVVINNDKDIPLTSHRANREGPTVSIWSNCPGCSVITVLTGEREATIILPRRQGAQTKSLSNLSKGNPRSRPKPLSRHSKSKLR